MFDLLRDRWLARQRRLDHRMFYRRTPWGWVVFRAALIILLCACISFVRLKNGGLEISLDPSPRPMLYVAVAWIGWTTVRRGIIYRRGWMEGRAALRSSMFEATMRDMTVDEWMNAELDRDARTLGYDTFDTFTMDD